jgi:hypothetical protein
VRHMPTNSSVYKSGPKPLPAIGGRTPHHRNPLVRDALALLARHGFAATVSNGKHLKVRWSDSGRRFTLIIPRTPSEHRARLNSRAVLRRLLRS